MLTPTTCPATLFGLGTSELIVILIIILLLFGGANLPKLTRSLGSSIKEFKKAVSGEEEAPAESTAAPPAPAPAPAAQPAPAPAAEQPVENTEGAPKDQG